jgi:hypothetical protein
MKKKKFLYLILLGFCASLFLFFHFSIYTEYDAGFPFITSATQSPIDSKRLELCERKFPDYFNPFQKGTYVYCIDGNANNLVSETVPNYFGYARMSKSEDISKYIGDFDFEGTLSVRDLIGFMYPNMLFFFMQYLLIGCSTLILWSFYKK